MTAERSPFVSEDTDARPPPPSKWNVTVTHQWRPMPAPTPPVSPVRQVCAIGTAAAIFFGSGVDRTVNKGPFNCPCDNLPPTTTTSSPPSSVTSAPPASSTPGTTPGVTVPPSVTPGTQPFRLPDTGAGTWPLAAVGALAILAGAGALVIVRRRGEEQ